MRRNVIALALLAAALFACEALYAQQMPSGKWWRREAVIQQLQLTSEQQDKLDEIFRVAADSLIDSRAEVEKTQVALRAEIERTQVRRQEVQRLAVRLSDARGKLFEREVLMLVDMRAVLTDQQWTKMRMFLDRLQEGAMRDRPNGGKVPNPNRPRPNPRRQK
jgi:Spy/CpxP family protein refolding chaperone